MKFYTNGFPTGLADVQYVFQDDLAVNIGVWSNVGVTESASSAGTYLVNVAVSIGAFRIAWRVESDPFVRAFEDIETPLSLQPVLDAITAQNGIGFDTATDSLRMIREGLDASYTDDDRTRDERIAENAELLRLSEIDPPQVIVVPEPPPPPGKVALIVDTIAISGEVVAGAKVTATIQGEKALIFNGEFITRDREISATTGPDGRAVLYVPQSSLLSDSTGEDNLYYHIKSYPLFVDLKARISEQTKLVDLIEAQAGAN